MCSIEVCIVIRGCSNVPTAGRTINTQACLTDQAFQFKRHVQFISLDAPAM